MRGKTALALIVLGLGLAALAIKSSVRWGGTPLTIISELPVFSLTDQSGAPFTLDDLKGSATVVDFIFTRCMGPCPMMALEMGKLQNRFAAEPKLRFISVSVDPGNDTPQVLAEYASSVGATPGKWTFLTGAGEDIVKLSEEGFKLPASVWPAGHSTRFVLVDKFARIRGYYDSADPKGMETLVEDIGRLLRSKEG